MSDMDDEPVPGYSFPKQVLRFPEFEVMLHYFEQLSLFDATALLVGCDCTGLKLWPAAKALATYITTHPELIQDRNILELGAGAGLLGLIAMKLDAANVVITDSSQDSLDLIQLNVNSNQESEGKEKRVSVAALDWNEEPLQLQQQFGSFQTILGADLLYIKSSILPLFKSA